MLPNNSHTNTMKKSMIGGFLLALLLVMVHASHNAKNFEKNTKNTNQKPESKLMQPIDAQETPPAAVPTYPPPNSTDSGQPPPTYFIFP